MALKVIEEKKINCINIIYNNDYIMTFSIIIFFRKVKENTKMFIKIQYLGSIYSKCDVKAIMFLLCDFRTKILQVY